MKKFESFEPDKTPPENKQPESVKPEDTAEQIEKEDKYKSIFAEFHEQEVEKARKEIKKLIKRNKEIKKELDDLST